MSELKLDPHEMNQAGTNKIRAHLERTLAELREMNDTAASDGATAVTRGRIQEVKTLLALLTQRPE